MKNISISRRKFIQNSLLMAVSTPAMISCAKNAATGRNSFTGFMPISQEKQVGAQEHKKLMKEFGGEYNKGNLNKYIKDIGAKLATHAEIKEFNYQFTLLDSDIANAMALPGGYVYITRGLLAVAGSEAELAAVLAHELGHVNARHSAERYSHASTASILTQIGAVATAILTEDETYGSLVSTAGQALAGLYLSSFSQDQEYEADQLGVRYIAKAGYEADEMSKMLDNLRSYSKAEAVRAGRDPNEVDKASYLSTHPPLPKRTKQALIEATKAMEKPNPFIGRDRYLRQINGIEFAEGKRLTIKSVSSRDNISSLSKYFPYESNIDELYFKALNGITYDSDLQIGKKVKVVM